MCFPLNLHPDEKMSSRDLENLYDLFGITRYHANGLKGQGVRLLIIDTGTKSRTTSSSDANVHGLAVASLISPPHGSNVKGIAPAAHVTVADVQDPKSIPIDVVLQAIRKGIDDDVDIMCISLGTADPWGPMQELVSKAAEKGILVFAAAGNAGERGYEFPAACVDAIAVGSMNSARKPSPFNTKNDAVVVFAPGEKLKLPTGVNGSLEEFTGTSFATPFAAGVAALVLSAKRLQAGDKSLRLTRRQMVDTLRDPDHFGLNCTDHTYVMDKTCTDFAQNPSFVKTSQPNPDSEFRVKLGMGLLTLLLGIALASLWNRK